MWSIELAICIQKPRKMSRTSWFFLSSRRRHTRCGRDWSSDVCSSDLTGSVLLLNAGYPHHAPADPFPRLAADQQRQQFLDIHSVALRLPSPPVHLDAGRVHHPVLHPNALQIPVDPKTIAAGFVAAHHSTALAKTEPRLGASNLLLQGR